MYGVQGLVCTVHSLGFRVKMSVRGAGCRA